VTLLDADQYADALADVGERLAALMDTATRMDLPVKGLEPWTVGDLLVHVALLPSFYAGKDERFAYTPDAASMPETNKANLELATDVKPGEAAALLRTTLPDLLTLLRTTDPSLRRPAHASAELTLPELAGVGLGEWVVHGLDLARTLDRPWAIEADHAALVLKGAEALLPHWVDSARAKRFNTDVEIRLRTGTRHRWSFKPDGLTVDPEGPWKPDVVVRADPVALMLVFYGRISQWSAIARGKILATGRKPWRALKLSSNFLPP